MARSLYEIDSEILALIDPETGEISEENLEAFAALEMERDAKIEGVACLYKNITAEATMLKAEKQAFEARQKQADNTAKRLKQWLLNATGGEKFTSLRAQITFRSTTSVEVDEGVQLPQEYLRLKVSAEPDKDALKAALSAGVEIPGVRLVKSKSVTVK